MPLTQAERARLFKLLEQNTSLGVVSQFLKERNLRYSANTWPEMLEKRLEPALARGELTREHMISLLRDVEEYGRQHVFLFRAPQNYATEITSRNHIQHLLRRLDREDLLLNPPILDTPNELRFTDIRVEPVERGNLLTIKAVKGRLYRRFVDEHRNGRFISRQYEEVEVRAVNVFRVHPDGFTEMRIQSHENSSDYNGDIEEFWGLLNPLITRRSFAFVSLGPAKQYLWTRRTQLRSRIRYSNSLLRNTAGTILAAATGPEQASLYDDQDAAASLDTFLRGEAACDRSNVFWLRADNGTPSKDVHILLAGAINEFTITATSSRADYEFVLTEIKNANV
jgi:hypothetical protein